MKIFDAIVRYNEKENEFDVSGFARNDSGKNIAFDGKMEVIDGSNCIIVSSYVGADDNDGSVRDFEDLVSKCVGWKRLDNLGELNLVRKVS